MNKIKIFIIKYSELFIVNMRQGSLKNIFGISGLLKLFFLYSVTVIYIILFNFSFYPNISILFNDNKQPNVVLYGIENRIGEHILHDELITAAQAKNWNIISFYSPEELMDYAIANHFYSMAASVVNYFFQPLFTLSTTHSTYLLPYNGFNIIYINVPLSMLINGNHQFSKRFHFLNYFDGYIDLNSFSKVNARRLERTLGTTIYQQKLIIPAYLSRSKIYQRHSIAEKALITGSLWGCSRGSTRFRIALGDLAINNYVDAIGLDDYAYLGDAYRGLINNDPACQLIKKTNRYGIGLISHNLDHLIEEIPTNRLAEVIASSALIITDAHPFIKKHFKALYFDYHKLDTDIYTEIKNHIDWAKQHQNEVQDMIAHNIRVFNEKFALEIVLDDILQKVQNHKRQYLINK